MRGGRREANGEWRCLRTFEVHARAAAPRLKSESMPGRTSPASCCSAAGDAPTGSTTAANLPCRRSRVRHPCVFGGSPTTHCSAGCLSPRSARGQFSCWTRASVASVAVRRPRPRREEQRVARPPGRLPLLPQYCKPVRSSYSVQPSEREIAEFDHAHVRVLGVGDVGAPSARPDDHADGREPGAKAVHDTT